MVLEEVSEMPATPKDNRELEKAVETDVLELGAGQVAEGRPGKRHKSMVIIHK